MTFDTAVPAERAYLVGLEQQGNALEAEDSLEELATLVLAAGATVVGQATQHRRTPDPNTWVGKGKAEELAIERARLGADLIVFDDELSPKQQKNLEELLGVRVIDRSAVILDIFARHARSREGQLQVELAQMEYRMPRLAGLGKEMSRLGGGINTRGPGESKLESDRQVIRRRIQELKERLAPVAEQHDSDQHGNPGDPGPEMGLLHERPPADEASLAAETWLGIDPYPITAEMAARYLADSNESASIYAEEGLVHPRDILRSCNFVLSRNVLLGPWIHTGSRVQHLAAAAVGVHCQCAPASRAITRTRATCSSKSTPWFWPTRRPPSPRSRIPRSIGRARSRRRNENPSPALRERGCFFSPRRRRYDRDSARSCCRRPARRCGAIPAGRAHGGSR